MIAMTGHYTGREHALLIEQCGISLCLVKPLNLADVIERIELVTRRGLGRGGVAKPGAGERKHGRASERAKHVAAHMKGESL